MWQRKCGLAKPPVLSSEMLDSLAELYCEVMNLSPRFISRQVKERIKQHALIVGVGISKKEFAFDHDDFREFFLGEQIADHLQHKREADLRKIFRTDLLPALALDTATHAFLEAKIDIEPR